MPAILKDNKVVPVVVIENADHAVPVAEALMKGGVNVIEITFRTAAAPDAIRNIKSSCPDMIVGAGTVVTPAQAKTCFDAGVDFAVAPGTNPTTIKLFQENGTAFFPGVMTPSDIELAYSLGCTMLKFFPAEAAGGIPLLKSLAGPYASLGLKFCPTGGINVNNFTDYLALPYVAAIGGSWLVKKDQIASENWEVITEQAAAAIEELG